MGNKEKCVLCNLTKAVHIQGCLSLLPMVKWNGFIKYCSAWYLLLFFSSSLVDDPLYLQSINDFSISEVYLINAKSVI